MNSDDTVLQETYRLTKENNKILHAMRRNAFWGGIIKFILYAALILAPLWFYLQYLAPVVDGALKEMQQVQGTGASAQAQLINLQNALKSIESRIPGFGTTTSQ